MELFKSKTFLIPAAILVVLLVVVIGVFALTGGDGDEEQAAESAKGPVEASELKVGDCISDANSRLGDVTTFDAVACDEPHDGEVYTLIKLEGGPNAKFPGDVFVNGKGQRGCRARLRRQATRKAFRDKQLGFKFVYPTPASWAEGDREITCVATFKKPRSKRLEQREQRERQ